MRLFLSLVLAALSAVSPARADLKDEVPHIVVTGKAERMVVPDRARVTIGVEIERETAARASREARDAARAVIATIKDLGIAEQDMTTEADVRETFTETRDTAGKLIDRKPKGFKARITLSVRVKDITRVGPLVSRLVAAGANTVSGIEFSLSREKEVKAEVEVEALRRAREEAASIAEAAGVKLGRVLSIRLDPPPDGAADMPMRVQATGPTTASLAIEPGVQMISSLVEITWELAR